MVSHRDVEKLLGVGDGVSPVLSLYLAVPKDPGARRGLAARAGELLALAAGSGAVGAGGNRVSGEDRQAVLGLLEHRAAGWLGHTAAVFVSGRLGLREAFRLPCELPERAVLALRPHVRPLLAALQRCPAYHVAVIDQRHAWVLRVEGERIHTVSQTSAPGVRSPGFGGWYGLETHRISERIVQLARHHYHDSAALLEQAMHGEGGPVVAGGHEQTIPAFTAVLPPRVRDHVIGSFTADPHTLTPARARDLSRVVVEDWVNRRERDLVLSFLLEPPGPTTALGMNACLTAVNQHAVQLLVVPVGGVVPGYACSQCGALSSTGSGCTHGGGASRAVPDLIEEMAVATLQDGGEVTAVHDPPAEIAARLRFPVTAQDLPPPAR